MEDHQTRALQVIVSRRVSKEAKLAELGRAFAKWRSQAAKATVGMALETYAASLEELRAEVAAAARGASVEQGELGREATQVRGEIGALRRAVARAEAAAEAAEIRAAAIEEEVRAKMELQMTKALAEKEELGVKYAEAQRVLDSIKSEQKHRGLALGIHRRAVAERYVRSLERKRLLKAFAAWRREATGRTTLSKAGKWAARTMHRQTMANVFRMWQLQVVLAARERAEGVAKEATQALGAVLEREQRRSAQLEDAQLRAAAASGLRDRAMAVVIGREDAFWKRSAFDAWRATTWRSRQRERGVVARHERAVRFRTLRRVFLEWHLAAAKLRVEKTAGARRRMQMELDTLRGALTGARRRYEQSEKELALAMQGADEQVEAVRKSFEARLHAVTRPSEMRALVAERSALAGRRLAGRAAEGARAKECVRVLRAWRIHVHHVKAIRRQARFRAKARRRKLVTVVFHDWFRYTMERRKKRLMLRSEKHSDALQDSYRSEFGKLESELDEAKKLLEARELHFETVDARRRRAVIAAQNRLRRAGEILARGWSDRHMRSGFAAWKFFVEKRRSMRHVVRMLLSGSRKRAMLGAWKKWQGVVRAGTDAMIAAIHVRQREHEKELIERHQKALARAHAEREAEVAEIREATATALNRLRSEHHEAKVQERKVSTEKLTALESQLTETMKKEREERKAELEEVSAREVAARTLASRLDLVRRRASVGIVQARTGATLQRAFGAWRAAARADQAAARMAEVFVRRAARTQMRLSFELWQGWSAMTKRDRYFSRMQELDQSLHLETQRSKDATAAKARAETKAARLAQELARAQWALEKEQGRRRRENADAAERLEQEKASRRDDAEAASAKLAREQDAVAAANAEILRLKRRLEENASSDSATVELAKSAQSLAESRLRETEDELSHCRSLLATAEDRAKSAEARYVQEVQRADKFEGQASRAQARAREAEGIAEQNAEQLTYERARAAAASSDYEALERKVQVLEAELSSLRTERTAHLEQRAHWTERAALASKLEQDLEELSSTLAATETERDKLRDGILQAEKRHEQAEERSSIANRRAEAADLNLQQAEERADQAERRLAECTATLERLQRSSADASTIHEEALRKVASLQAELETLQHATQSSQALEQQITQLQHELEQEKQAKAEALRAAVTSSTRTLAAETAASAAIRSQRAAEDALEEEKARHEKPT